MRFAFSCIIVLLIVLVSNYCFSAGQPFVQSNDKKVTIGVVLPPPDHPWLAENAKYAQKAASMLGGKCRLILLNSAKDSATQINEVESLLTKKVDGIVLFAIEGSPLTPICKKIKRAGIPLASVSRIINSNDYTIKVEGDNKLIGRMAAEYIGKKLRSGKVALITGVPGASDSLDRINGFKNEIKNYPNIELVASLPGHFVIEKGMSAMENILTAHPEVKAVYALSDAMALGADMAIKSRGLTNKIFIIGSDGNKEMFKRIKNDKSSCVATITYPPSMTGDAVLFIYLAIQGKGIPGTFDPLIPVSYKVRSTLITKDDIDKYQHLAF
jgi:ribose transport system substrate-binding protein